MVASLERSKYWAEQIQDACVEENETLKRRLSEVHRAHLQCSEKIGERDERVLELAANHRSVQQERDKLLTEKADTKSQLEAGETAYRQLQQQLEASHSHHRKQIEEMQQALSREQNISRQRGLENLKLKDALTVKEKELKDNEADLTKWTTDVEEQLKKLKKRKATRKLGFRT